MDKGCSPLDIIGSPVTSAIKATEKICRRVQIDLKIKGQIFKKMVNFRYFL
jgi:hypothetical protein